MKLWNRSSASFSLAFAEMRGQTSYNLLRRDLEGLADPKQRRHCNRATSLNHLPVTDAEAIRNHVLLAKFTFCPIRAYSVAQRAEVPCVMGR